MPIGHLPDYLNFLQTQSAMEECEALVQTSLMICRTAVTSGWVVPGASCLYSSVISSLDKVRVSGGVGNHLFFQTKRLGGPNSTNVWLKRCGLHGPPPYFLKYDNCSKYPPPENCSNIGGSHLGLSHRLDHYQLD